jgi:hypothetical protein
MYCKLGLLNKGVVKVGIRLSSFGSKMMPLLKSSLLDLSSPYVGMLALVINSFTQCHRAYFSATE